MRNRFLVFTGGLVLGLIFVFLLGAARDQLELSGLLTIKNPDQGGRYQSSISGVADNGDCYIAVTNTVSGRTEVFRISEYVRKELRELSSGSTPSFIFEVNK